MTADSSNSDILRQIINPISFETSTIVPNRYRSACRVSKIFDGNPIYD